MYACLYVFIYAHTNYCIFVIRGAIFFSKFDVTNFLHPFFNSRLSLFLSLSLSVVLYLLEFEPFAVYYNITLPIYGQSFGINFIYVVFILDKLLFVSY